jgi:hypothetical protein
MVQRAVRGGKRPSLWCEQLHAVVVEVCDRQQERVVAASVAALFARPHEAHSVGPEKLALTFPRSTDPTSTGHQIPQPAAAASRRKAQALLGAVAARARARGVFVRRGFAQGAALQVGALFVGMRLYSRSCPGVCCWSCFKSRPRSSIHLFTQWG